MTTARIPRHSGRMSVLALSTMLKLSIKPELAVEGKKQLEDSRRSMDRWGAWMPALKGVKWERQRLAGLDCEVHVPRKAHSNQVMLYFHGGGFAVGSAVSHRQLVSRLAREAAIKVISMDYRRSPEHPFPAALEDTVKIYRHCLDQGIKPANIVFCGDSAGGNLVFTTLLKLKQDGLPLPAAGCGISPWCDLTMKAASIQANADKDLILSPRLLQQFADLYAPESNRADPLMSPLFGDLAGLPPLLIQVGTSEILLDDAIALAQRAEAAGVPVELEIWDDMQHVWHYTAFLLKDGRRAIRHIASFARRHLDGSR